MSGMCDTSVDFQHLQVARFVSFLPGWCDNFVVDRARHGRWAFRITCSRCALSGQG
jgi:hypothetical protein